MTCLLLICLNCRWQRTRSLAVCQIAGTFMRTDPKLHMGLEECASTRCPDGLDDLWRHSLCHHLWRHLIQLGYRRCFLPETLPVSQDRCTVCGCLIRTVHRWSMRCLYWNQGRASCHMFTRLSVWLPLTRWLR